MQIHCFSHSLLIGLALLLQLRALMRCDTPFQVLQVLLLLMSIAVHSGRLIRTRPTMRTSAPTATARSPAAAVLIYIDLFHKSPDNFLKMLFEIFFQFFASEANLH